MVFTACVTTSPDSNAYDGEPAAPDDRFRSGLTAWADTIKRGGVKAILQLHHGGASARPGLVPNGDIFVSSRIAHPGRSKALPASCPMSRSRKSSKASEPLIRGIKAGFNGVEIHGGYGYLPQQLLSPYPN